MYSHVIWWSQCSFSIDVGSAVRYYRVVHTLCYLSLTIAVALYYFEIVFVLNDTFVYIAESYCFIVGIAEILEDFRSNINIELGHFVLFANDDDVDV